MELINHNKNNFDFIRFVAACSVIISHSVPLTGNGILYSSLITKSQVDLGALSVDIFFIVSGFLITSSYERVKDLKKFIISRALRIYPALMVVIILTLFVIVPMVTTVSLRDYFTTKKTWEYLLGITIPFSGTRFTLPGFSTGANVKFADAINGSLWTLSGEIKCYLIVAFLGVTRLIKFRYLILLTWIIVIINFNLHLDSNIARFHTYFGSGIIYYLFKDK
ncbi:MAG: acyltransferase, partial [Neisseriaceae bacterium]